MSSPRHSVPITSPQPSAAPPCCLAVCCSQPDGTRPGSRRWHTRDDASLIARAYERWGRARRSSESKARARSWSATRRSRSSSQLATVWAFTRSFTRGTTVGCFSPIRSTRSSISRRISNAINLSAVADHLRHVWAFADETYFERVHRVPPGNVLRRNGRRSSSARYWDPAPDGDVDWIRPDEDRAVRQPFRAGSRPLSSPGKGGNLPERRPRLGQHRRRRRE